jgi:hypothetical protein
VPESRNGRGALEVVSGPAETFAWATFGGCAQPVTSNVEPTVTNAATDMVLRTPIDLKLNVKLLMNKP